MQIIQHSEALFGQDWRAIWRRVTEQAALQAARAPQFWGTLLMLATTSLWAIAFIVPLVLDGSSAAEITFGRFFVYGIISLLSLNLALLRRAGWRILGLALVFAVAGNVAYYFVLTLGIQMSGAPLAILVIGMLPVTVSVLGRLTAQEGSLREIALPLLTFGAGVLIFNLGKTDFLRDVEGFSLLGAALLLAALAMWTWYAVANARFLRARRQLAASDWSSLVGVASLVAILCAAPLFYLAGDLRNPAALPAEELAPILLWSLILGGGSTWLGTILFNLASRLLKVSLLGQLIIFEALFGVFYVFVALGDRPSWVELGGIALALVGIWWSIRRLQRESPAS
jgi:drug/metabolite transporter (DMT)-like permease